MSKAIKYIVKHWFHLIFGPVMIACIAGIMYKEFTMRQEHRAAKQEKLQADHQMVAEGKCPNLFKDWKEVPSPFRHERCFVYAENHNWNGMICRPIEFIETRDCLDWKNNE